MLTVISGLPGAGKSYLSVHMLKGYADQNLKLAAEGKPTRPLYTDINGVTIEGVSQIEDQIYNLPNGSIIFLDEAQQHRVFASGFNFAKHEKQVSADDKYDAKNDRHLNTHRHHGHDIFLITQSANLLSANIRDVSRRHIHCTNPNNMDYCKYYVLPQMFPRANQATPEKLAQLANGEVKRLNFKPEIHSLYKSTALDTKKKEIPWGKIIKFVLIALALVLLLILAFRRSMDTTIVKSMSGDDNALNQGLNKVGTLAEAQIKPVETPDPVLPHPSSIYGYQPDLTTYNHEYAFAGCVWMGDKRHCIAHDGSTLKISDQDFERFKAGDRPQRSQRRFDDQNKQAVSQVLENTPPAQNSIDYPAPPPFESA